VVYIKLLRLWSREVDMDTKRNTGKETKKMVKNEMDLRFDARSENEAFARVAVAGFVSVLNPTLEELSDIKTAVSEAVTNAIIHGYEIYGVEEEELLAEKITEGLAVMPQVFLHGRIEGDVLELLIRDEGCGIADIEQAMEPLYTTKPDLDRSGMGFSFMEAFMDDLEVESVLGQGTTVHMKKKLGTTSWIEQEE
jgi:stage II sporulation protein AB (anti-sigma F factor)